MCIRDRALNGLEADDWNALERDVVDLFTALLRVDTTNPPGNETACALILKDYLAGNGIESTLVGDYHEEQARAVAAAQGGGKAKAVFVRLPPPRSDGVLSEPEPERFAARSTDRYHGRR